MTLYKNEISKSDMIDKYKGRKSEYEEYQQTDHPEYQKICEWLKENESCETV